jgi:hypothetical protein
VSVVEFVLWMKLTWSRARLAKIKQHEAAGISKSAKHLGRELV